MMAFSEFTTELPGAINRRIHLPPKLMLGFREGGYDVPQRDFLADHHNVDVACRSFASGGNRAIDEGQLNIAPQGDQAVVQNLSHAKRFADEPTKFLKDGALPVGLKIGLPALDGAR